MKKIIWIVVIVILAVIGFYLYKGQSSSSTTLNTPTNTNTQTNTPENTQPTNQPAFVPATKSDTTLLTKLNSASVSAAEDGTSVALTNGVASFSVSGSSVKYTVSLYSSPLVGNVNVTKDFNGRKDVLAVVTVSSEQKNAQYLVLFTDTGTTLNQKSIAYLGDSLDVRSLVVTDLGASSGEDYVTDVTSHTQSGQTVNSIIPVKGGTFDTTNSLTI